MLHYLQNSLKQNSCVLGISQVLNLWETKDIRSKTRNLSNTEVRELTRTGPFNICTKLTVGIGLISPSGSTFALEPSVFPSSEGGGAWCL